MTSTADDFSHSQDFKLCGFLPFVVSVLNPPPKPAAPAESIVSEPPPPSTVPPGTTSQSSASNLSNVGSSAIFSEELPSKVSRVYSRRNSRSSTGGDPLRILFGAECWLTGEGPEVQFLTKGGFALSPILNPTPQKQGEEVEATLNAGCREDDGTSPIGMDALSESSSIQKQGASNKKRKRQSGFVDDGVQLLSNVQMLTVRNGVRVKGHVVRIARKADQVRAAILLDLYLPSFLWSGRNYWKPNLAFTTILNHLSCNWEERSLSLITEGRKIEYEDCKELWHLGNCQVLGCNLHMETTEALQQSRFDMHAIFKSLPSLKGEQTVNTTICPEDETMWSIDDLPDSVLMSVLSMLCPRDLQSVACTCKHIHSLVEYIMPCMNLKLFPHQHAAVLWMLQRELHPAPLHHPLYKDLQTEDGFHFYLNCLSGDLSPEAPPPVMDFRGGLFCDEPGLGKTVTALSLILKTQGSLATHPPEVHVKWCEHSSGDRYGYYEICSYRVTSVLKRSMELKAKRNKMDSHSLTSVSSHHLATAVQTLPVRKRPRVVSSPQFSSPLRRISLDAGPATRASSAVKRRLSEEYESLHEVDSSVHDKSLLPKTLPTMYHDGKGEFWHHDVWVQCDACSKWRKIELSPDEGLAWFCNMNKDPLYQSCSDPEEDWECGLISSFPGFYKVGGASGLEPNVIHFANVIKEYAAPRRSDTQAALSWLANIDSDKLAKMSTAGVVVPNYSHFTDPHPQYEVMFQKFGLVQKKNGKGPKKWFYPPFLDGLVFDLPALREALNKPLDVFRLYLSRATLVVVPANLVDHWKKQIMRHTKLGQLRVCVLVDQKNAPKVQDLAWNFDVVITTFSRLSCEWSYKESSILMGVHWLRIILDEGHTLGASLSLTNKLQMAMSMHASRRWVLTGTPTPHTPNSQVAHLQPMLKYLHEEVYGSSQKSWEAGILKPFEAGSEEGRTRLLELLHRCMISARKSDLRTIPPCIRKVVLLDFTQKHAESYNELVATVRRNILMADWNDPSHVESLLNPKQWKFRSNTIRNVRLSCCVAGHIKVENAGQDIQETMDILAQDGLDPLSWDYAVVKNALLVGGTCSRCDEWCRLPIITPCKHLLCLDCVAMDREKCTYPGCGNPYKMQSPQDLTRPENPNPKWPVPQDLIELQPSYVQDNWDPDWQATSSSKVAYLVERLKSLKPCGASHDKVKWSGGKLASIVDDGTSTSQTDLPEKAIVFSQFLEHIHVIESQLLKAGIKVAGLYSPMHSANKLKSLWNFQRDKDCTVLLMDGSAALGLDLSFVTHVYLMEPIWDRSVEEQVVSRAHRMGATRPVLVETLAMRGTIEEQMVQFLQDSMVRNIAEKRDPDSGHSGQRTLHDFAESSYLAQLSHVRTKAAA
ncbi:hypothetical protein GOP47_0030461 [Adiantum capillus-veneris]|nr:hypothetical protein GOP47_0030155 [Adiantum capillus-veneris]KAI5055316.1 hypothetical protein GOP47_0030461 [Adiantum capillus-veneris]